MVKVVWETGQPPHRTFNDWIEDPWAAPADQARRRRERHARWIASISARDWERLSALVDQVTDVYNPARLDDLDADIAIGACSPGAEHRFSGQVFGRLRGYPLLAWPKARKPAGER